jgi:hypothetical protein
MIKKGFISIAQAACLRLYAKGDFEHLLDSKTEEEFVAAYKGAGDTLLTFLMIELSASEDCESLAQAVGRVDNAIDDLKGVKTALDADLRKLGDLHVRVTLSTQEGRTGQFVIGSKSRAVWDKEDTSGHDVTQAALFESFRLGKTGQPEFVDSYNASGDDWRAIEDMGDQCQITNDVRDGVELEVSVKRQVHEYEPA